MEGRAGRFEDKAVEGSSFSGSSVACVAPQLGAFVVAAEKASEGTASFFDLAGGTFLGEVFVDSSIAIVVFVVAEFLLGLDGADARTPFAIHTGLFASFALSNTLG